MDADRLRSRGDRELAESLKGEDLVRRMNERIEKAEEESPRGVRRHLLATSLRLTESMMPDVYAEVAVCRERLGVEAPLELYVYPAAEFNAAAVKPEAGRLFVMLSSSLLEAFSPGERRFVIGHELGHHVYDHHDIPIGQILRGRQKPPASLALQLFAWSRWAEISADRAGAHCTDDPKDVARALFRLASGLRRPLQGVNIDEFLAQIDEMALEQDEPGRGAPRSDWFATHPFSPLRLKALGLFFGSELAMPGGESIGSLEAQVQALLALMEPSYLEERSEKAEAARRLLFAAALAVASAGGQTMDEDETAALEKLLGEGALGTRVDVEATVATLPDRVREAGEQLTQARRIQVLRDVCVIARADGHTSPEERAVIDELATQLGVPREVVEGTLLGPPDLD